MREHKKETNVVVTNNTERKSPMETVTNVAQVVAPWITVSNTSRKGKEPKVIEVECNNGFESLLGECSQPPDVT